MKRCKLIFVCFGSFGATVVALLLLATTSSAQPQLDEILSVFAHGDVQAVNRAVDQLVAVGAAAIPRLEGVMLVQDEDTILLRQRTARALGRIGGEAAVRVLAIGFDDPYADVRLAAARGLERIGRNAVSIIELLGQRVAFDPSAEVRQSAAATLGKIGPEAKAVLPAMLLALGDRDATVALAASMALRQVAADVIPFGDRVTILSGLLQDHDDPLVQLHAAWGLAGAVPVTVDTLGRVTPSIYNAVIALKEALLHEDEDIQRAAEHALQVANRSIARAEGLPVPLGEMKAFWRYRPVLDRWLVGGLGITTVPSYFFETSFPYEPRPYPQEVLFADGLTVVRILGGWNEDWAHGELDWYEEVSEADLVYRDEDGVMQYRFDRIQPRLDPYIALGYTDLTIVLDNIPWGFPDVPTSASYGQTAPPADFLEWEAFISAFVQELVDLYGYDTVSNWRFRLGTENQTEERFTGSRVEYYKMYDHAAAAIKSVVPEAAVGPYNLAGGLSFSHNVPFLELMYHAAHGVNYATGEVGSPVDFLPISFYDTQSRSPDRRDGHGGRIWDAAGDIHPLWYGLPREIHEFGVLGSAEGLATSEPGARGGAWTFHSLVELLNAGLKGVWHWGVTEDLRVPSGSGQEILRSNGWLFSILEHTVGGLAYSVPLQLPEDAIPGVVYQGMFVVDDSRTTVMVSAHHEDRDMELTETVTVQIPRQLLLETNWNDARYTYLGRDNSVYDILWEDFRRQGLLFEPYAQSGVVSTINNMAHRPGWQYVSNNYDHYVEIMVDSLTLKPFSGWVETADSVELRFEMAAPMVMVIVLE